MKKTILVIDDNPELLDAIRMLLEDDGYNVITCNRGDYAEHIVRKARDIVDVIILDVFLSGIDGRDIAKRLKEYHSTKQIPIIMFSAQPDIEATAWEAGADEFISKPFQIKELLHRIDKFTAEKSIIPLE